MPEKNKNRKGRGLKTIPKGQRISRQMLKEADGDRDAHAESA